MAHCFHGFFCRLWLTVTFVVGRTHRCWYSGSLSYGQEVTHINHGLLPSGVRPSFVALKIG